MNIRQHGPNLYQIERRFPFSINAYLVREDDGLTLIDTGIGGTAPDILKAAQQLGQPIRRIALTHAHGDHVGSLDALRAALPEAEISISGRDARLLAGDRTLDSGEPPDKLRGGYLVTQTRPDRLLRAGDRVGSLRVVASPGHTPGHVAFFDERGGDLIAGDALVTAGGPHVAGVLHLRFPISPFATYHRPLALDSARKLRDLRPARLAVGHGPVLERPAGAMARAIEEAERRFGAAGIRDSLSGRAR